MENKLTLFKLLLSILIVSMLLEQSSGIYFRRVHVHLKNDLNTSVLIHCKSGDKDLGPHQVENRKEYNFSFINNWRDTTLYFCHFEWLNHTRLVSATFDIYKSRRDEARCFDECKYWVSRDYITWEVYEFAGWIDSVTHGMNQYRSPFDWTQNSTSIGFRQTAPLGMSIIFLVFYLVAW